jgi:hypothetical protein
MGYGSDPLDAKLNLRVDDEQRIVIIGTPDGLDALNDAEILALLRRLRSCGPSTRRRGTP